MSTEPIRPVILQGGRLCGLPNITVKRRLDATEFVDDDDGRIYRYAKHHVSDEGVDVFRIVDTVHPKVTQKEPKAKKKSKPRKKAAKKKSAPRRDKKD